MRLIITAALVFAVFGTPAFASTSTDTMKACAASWKSMPAADKGKTTYKAYSSDCLKSGGPKATSLAPTPVSADMSNMSPQDRMKACAAKWDGMKKDGSAKGTTYKAFSATCLKK